MGDWIDINALKTKEGRTVDVYIKMEKYHMVAQRVA